ncbi:MAG: tRNA pseudouridine(55) synthase TruB [Desulfobacula sp.]|nr:tRNA pseudouridine(55) synthase TruB [Desulfobacula sp.]
MKSGILAIHKPEGISSARIVARVKKALGVKKVGHTGTLDPFATGLLLCAINKGTRISKFFLDGHKRYTAKVCLGVETDTYDLTGQVVLEKKAKAESLTLSDIKSAIHSFMGVQEQIPPAFSALKHKGQPLYKLARQGIKIQKPARNIKIFDIRVTKVEMPYVDIDVFCSSGTYIRTIAFDLGRNLGCGAHLSALCRTQSSHFNLKEAIDLAALEGLSKSMAQEKIISLSDALSFLPQIQVDAQLTKKIKFGQRLSWDELGLSINDSHPDQVIGIIDKENNLLAIVQLNEESQTYNYSCVFLS